MCASRTNDKSGLLPFSQITSETERWRAVDSPGVRVMRGVLLANVPCDRRTVPTTGLGSYLIGLADPPILTSGLSIPAVDKTRRRSHVDDRSLAIKEFAGAIALRSHHLRGLMPWTPHGRPRPAANVRAGWAEPVLTLPKRGTGIPEPGDPGPCFVGHARTQVLCRLPS
jgi:hypothetical protein